MAKKRANGEGNIRKRKDGRWEGRYTAGYDEKTGKRLIKNVLGKTQAEVKEKLAKANWWRCNGRIWISKTRPSPSASRPDATMRANPTSHVRKRKTRSEKSQSRKMPLICWSQNIKSIPITLGLTVIRN